MIYPIALTSFDEARPAALVVSHERSGTHFLMNSLASCYGYVSRPWVNLDPYESSLKIQYLSPRGVRDDLLALAAQRMANVVKSHYPVEFFHTELAALTQGYVIFVACRDPVGVMLSCWRYMHRMFRQGPKTPDPLAFARAEPCGWLMRYQLRQYPSMLRRWAAHVESWLDAARVLPRIVVVRYEDLDAKYEATVRGFEGVLERPPHALVRPASDVNVISGGPHDPTGQGVEPDVVALRRFCRETVGDTMIRLGYW